MPVILTKVMLQQLATYTVTNSDRLPKKVIIADHPIGDRRRVQIIDEDTGIVKFSLRATDEES